MDPTQDQAETRKLMASVKEAVDKIVASFKPVPPMDPTSNGNGARP